MNFDCALFDVDGVLVDIRRSYNEAIRKTVESMVSWALDGTDRYLSVANTGEESAFARKKNIRPYHGRSFYRRLVTDRLILKFRQSGGFNNDTDTSYAITLALLVNPTTSVISGTKYLTQVAESADESGILSVESFLKRRSFDVEKWKQALAYPPEKAVESPLARMFDELFYGPKLFRKQNGVDPKFLDSRKDGRIKPMIKNDKVAVKESTLQILSRKLDGKLAMVTGRSKIAANYSLGRLMDYFNTSGCVFLEDEPREHAKPNPYAVIRAMKSMNAKNAIYAGDSTEDLLMAKRAAKQEPDLSISFVGIYGFSPSPLESARSFEKAGVLAVARDVNRLPAIIQKLK